MATIYVFIGDTAPDVTDTIKEVKSDGSKGPINLTGLVAVNFRMRSKWGSAVLIDQPGSVVGAPVNGAVRYDWTLSDTTTAIDSTPGPYRAWWWLDFGGGTQITTPEFDVFMLSHADDRREVGPCTPWCSTQDVLACDPDLSPSVCLTNAVESASEVLYELSGRTFDGWCQSTIRPCQNTGCWGGGWGTQILSRGHIIWNGRGWMQNDEPCSCGGWLQKVKLPGIAQSVVRVMINGSVLAPSAYRLDPDNTLIRTDGGGWPICQNMNVAGDAQGAFEIIYQHGYAPNQSARDAAAALAREFCLACLGGACALPSGVVEIVRQGIKVTRVATIWEGCNTGIPLVDAFLAAYGSTPTYVFSPDTYPTSRRTA